jgi:hypothetical protein
MLKRLDDIGLAQNTIVVYFSDNGPNSWRWNGGMKGKKGSTDEGGVRSPLFLRWPGHIRPGTRITQIASAIDLLPTLADLAGISLPNGKPLDGLSLAPLLLEKSVSWPDRLIFSHWAGKVSVRTQNYRLDDSGRLYDMSRDPGQTTDISQDRPEIASRLAKEVANWSREMLPSLKKDDRPFPVGYPEFPTTWLPARDGVPHGKIRRSAPAPNCSYFTNWVDRKDFISWPIEVATAGRYEAIVYYTCRPEDVGATLVLDFNGNHVQTRVSEANNPPSRGAEHDRVKRGTESYVKDFKPLRLGTLKLKQGRGSLKLQASEMPGQRVIEVRAMTLTLITQ